MLKIIRNSFGKVRFKFRNKDDSLVDVESNIGEHILKVAL
jgi:hypothetical protein